MNVEERKLSYLLDYVHTRITQYDKEFSDLLKNQTPGRSERMAEIVSACKELANVRNQILDIIYRKWD